jgi:hypothetical protein
MPTLDNLVARKTVTHIQAGSVYKHRWTVPFDPPVGASVRIEFLVSDGSTVATVDGEFDGRYAKFYAPYSEVEVVPNGALFYVYMHIDGEPAEDEHMLYYGSVFRREHVFPNSPAIASDTVVRQFEDSFNRPAGAVGGRWKVLVGRPVIFDNASWWSGYDGPNTVGPQYTFLSRYFMYYYLPFNDDSVELSVSATDKGSGKTIITLCQNSTASSYLYVGFDSAADPESIELGYGTGPDIGIIGGGYAALEPQVEDPGGIDIPGNNGMATFKIRYDDSTKKLGVYSDDYTTTFAEWVDTGNIVPHGRGYRYFGVGGNSGVLDSGVQIANLKAAGIV